MQKNCIRINILRGILGTQVGKREKENPGYKKQKSKK